MQRTGGVSTAEVDSSAPFPSVMEAVNRFGGGVSFFKPHKSSQVIDKKVSAVTEESETLEILKEFEATKTRFEELKVKLEQQLAKINTCPSDSGDENNTNVDDHESKADILKKVEDIRQQVKHFTRVLEEALSASSEFKNNDKECDSKKSNSNTNTMSIGLILKRKLVLAEEKNSNKTCIRWKTSLAHILSKATKGEKRSGRDGSCSGSDGGGGGGSGSDGGGDDQGIPAKRMRFGFCV